LRRPRNEEEEEEEEEEEDLRCSDVFLPLDFRREAFLCDTNGMKALEERTKT